MINVTRTDKPAELTETLQKELTDKFKATSESVWNLEFLKNALLAMSHNKCVYSECKLQTEGKYMEVEHYFPKEKYKDDVMEWDNLLPANKKCNGTKGKHDPKLEPIINPCVHTPKKHLILREYRFYHKTTLGKTTIEVTAINGDHFVKARFDVGDRIKQKLDELRVDLEDIMAEGINTERKLRRKIAALNAIMIESNPDCEYSATVATILVHDENFFRIKEILQHLGRWDADFAEINNYIHDIAFDNN